MARKILIVDDSASLRQQLTLTLNKAGYVVEEAVDGTDGLTKLRNVIGEPISMVITDVNMPIMDGLDMLAEIKKDGSFTRIPVIVLTTEGAAVQIRRAKDLGAKAWFVKPFEPDKLIDAVKKIMGPA